ncbi:MAG: hypothetical protein IKW71_00110, partial [Elusimicrobiaceae bacterium]|nr:hypothetical protein [Elusimicrobiaceae bacterium]
AHTEPWGDFLDIKLCDKPLHPSQLFHQHVMLSSVTDAYNPFEKKYEVTRRILQQLVACQAYVSVLTKSALVVRDIDLLKQLPGCEVGFSFSTADDTVRQQLEPGASCVQERLDALKAVHQAGLPTAVMAAPLLPGVSDFKAIVRAAAPYTCTFRFDSLNMKALFQHKLMDFVEVHYPHLLSLYNQIYLQGKRTYWEELQQEIQNYGRENNLSVEIFFGKASSFSFAPAEPETALPTPQDDADPFQPQLF